MVRNTTLVFLACVFFWKLLAACINDVFRQSKLDFLIETFAESIDSNMSILVSSLIDTTMKMILVHSKLKLHQSLLSVTSMSSQDSFQSL